MNNKHLKVAITGGMGFIATNLCKYLNDLGYKDIDLFDYIDNANLSTKWKNLIGLSYNGLYHPNNLDMSTNRYDILFHLGADVSTATRPDQFEKVWKENYLYTKSLVQPCSAFDTTLVYASSAATYGDSNDFRERVNNLNPLNFYGYTKLAIDQYLTDAGYFDLKRFYGLRFFNVFGPREDHKENMISGVSKFWKTLKYSNDTAKLFKSLNSKYKNGEQARDFVSVYDVCKVMVHCALIEKVGKGGIYNVGSGRATTWNSIVESINKVKNISTSTVYVDMPEKLKDQYQYYTCADLTKLRDVLGYKDEFLTVEQALKAQKI